MYINIYFEMIWITISAILVMRTLHKQ